jgi:WhiB family redox-sensing transcriptional regulator
MKYLVLYIMKNSRLPPVFENADCASLDVNIFFAKDPDEPGYRNADSEYTEAKKICIGCNYRVECADWGIKNEIHGMWGGMSPRERQKIRRLSGIKVADIKPV